MARLPLRFEENRGQASSEAHFLARAAGYSMELTAHGPSMTMGERRVDLRLLKSNPSPAVEGEQRMPTATNYFVGRRQDWRTGVSNYARVRYRDVYPASMLSITATRMTWSTISWCPPAPIRAPSGCSSPAPTGSASHPKAISR